jgi:hypothetical protein
MDGAQYRIILPIQFLVEERPGSRAIAQLTLVRSFAANYKTAASSSPAIELSQCPAGSQPVQLPQKVYRAQNMGQIQNSVASTT